MKAKCPKGGNHLTKLYMDKKKFVAYKCIKCGEVRSEIKTDLVVIDNGEVKILQRRSK